MKRYIKVSKNYFKKLNCKIEFDWDSFYRIWRLEHLKRLRELIKRLEIHKKLYK